MKSILIAAAVAASLVASGAALASENLAKSNGCLTCHAVAQKKMGPSFKDVAAKYKGKADAAANITAALSSGKGHPAVKAKGDDLKAIVGWALQQ